MLVLLACSLLSEPVVSAPAPLSMEQAVAQLPADSTAPMLQREAGTLRLVGRVVDMRDQPVSGAMIYVFDGPETPPLRTDAAGKWELLLPEMPVYMLNINVQAEGFARWADHKRYDEQLAVTRLTRPVDWLRAALAAAKSPEERVWGMAEMLYAQRRNPLRFPPGKETSPGVRELSPEEASYLLGEGSGQASSAEILAFEYSGVFLPELRAISVGAASAVLRAASAVLLEQLKQWEEKTLAEVITASDPATLAHLSCERWLSKTAPDCKPAIVEDRSHTRATWEVEIYYGDGGSLYQFVAHKEGDLWVLAQARERMHWSGMY